MTTPNEENEELPEEEEENHDDCHCAECQLTTVGGSVGTRFDAFVEHIQSLGFKHVGSGGFRRTYQRGKVVIKVPHVNDGLVDNRVEAAAWHKYKSQPTDLGVYLAPCRLLPNGCLMMVAIKHWDWVVEKPEWAYKIDSSQIGHYKGRAVAYDYGLDVTERYQWEKEWNHYSVFFQDDWVERKPHLKKASAA